MDKWITLINYEYIFFLQPLEEVLQSSEAVWMSKYAQILLYVTFNDTLVGNVHIPWYGEEKRLLYPEIKTFKYPKVNKSFS